MRKMLSSWKEVFPYEPRRGQGEMMDFVREKILSDDNLAIEAQNGWGKTITSLAAALSCNRERVIQCTRTHEQAEHIVEEFRAINSAADEQFRCTVLAAKWRLCINPWCRGGEVDCSEYLKKEGNDYVCAFEDISRGGVRELLAPAVLPRAVPKVLDIEAAREVGFYDGYCPYYLAKCAAEVSDVIVTPYNFVFSIPQRRSFGLDVSDSVVIVDEAHNLPSACRGLNTAAVGVDEVRSFVAGAKFLAGKDTLFSLIRLRNWIRDYPESATRAFAEKMTKGFVYGNDLLRELSLTGVDLGKMRALLALAEEGLDHEVYSLVSLLSLTKPEKAIAFISSGRLRYTLLDISDSISDVLQRRSRFLFISGTLSPIDPFRAEVGAKVEYRSFGSEIPLSRLQVELIGRRGEDVQISTAFNHRHDENTIMAYGEAIARLVALTPNGSIAMFPSYALKETMLRNWKIHGLVEGRGTSLRFSNGIRIHNEARGRDALPEYRRGAAEGQTALFAVFRGKVTEGTDLPYELCRGIFVVGIPFSAWGSPVVQGIIDYYDRTRFPGAGDSWYTYNAMTAVNQGIGRGIRDPEKDYCRVFLLDNRYIYRKAEVYNKLSDWIRKNVVSEGGATLEEVEERTALFFEKLGDAPPRSEGRRAAGSRP